MENTAIKERNELAKQIFAADPNIEPLAARNAADDMMALLYGVNWPDRDTPNAEAAQPTPTTKNVENYNATNKPDAVITIVDFSGEKWVRVQAMAEDFIIAPHDLKDAKGRVMADCDYDTLMARLKELQIDTFNRKQGFILATCIEQINAKLVEAGGDKFDADWYISRELWRPVGSSADYHGDRTWCFGGGGGCFLYNYRYFGSFRCRPVLAYSTIQS